MQTIRARGCPIDPPSLAMTFPPPSFRVSGKYFLVAHGPSLSTHAQISVMYCLGTLVLDRLVSTPHLRMPCAYSTGVGAATSDEEGGAGTTWDRASKAEWARHRVPEMRSGYILDVRCITSKLRTGSGNVLSQPRLRTDRSHAILISWCRPVCFSCVKPLRSTYASNFGCTSGKIPVFFGTRPPHRMRGSQGFGPT